MADVQTVLVIGAGTMGHGIAQVAAQSGYRARLCDLDAKVLEAGLAKIRKNLDVGVEKGKVTPAARDAALSRVSGASDAKAAARDADLVVEAVPERVDLKRRLFADLSAVAPAHAVFATNTSSLSIDEI